MSNESLFSTPQILFMKLIRLIFVILFFLPIASQAQNKKTAPNKSAAIASVDAHAKELTDLSDQVWSYAELAFHETKSSKVLADYAEAKALWSTVV
jgi:aminobenzoyl-glutamate utilization protein B